MKQGSSTRDGSEVTFLSGGYLWWRCLIELKRTTHNPDTFKKYASSSSSNVKGHSETFPKSNDVVTALASNLLHIDELLP